MNLDKMSMVLNSIEYVGNLEPVGFACSACWTCTRHSVLGSFFFPLTSSFLGKALSTVLR